MKPSIDGRLTKLEERQPRQHMLFVTGEYDSDEELRKEGIVLGPDDDVVWLQLVPVFPPNRPPWNEGRPVVSRSEA